MVGNIMIRRLGSLVALCCFCLRFGGVYGGDDDFICSEDNNAGKRWIGRTGRGVVEEFHYAKLRKVRDALSKFARIENALFGPKAVPYVGPSDPQLFNSFMKVKYVDVDGKRLVNPSWRSSMLVSDTLQRRIDQQQHPFEHVMTESTDYGHLSYWDVPPKRAELILDNHKLSHKYHPTTARPQHRPDTYPQHRPDTYPQHRPDTYPQQQPQQHWEESDWSNPSPVTEKPWHLLSKPLKVTPHRPWSSVSSFNEHNSGNNDNYNNDKKNNFPAANPQVSDTVLSKPLMVFDSLKGEPVQNVKVIHSRVVVADQRPPSSPGKLNSNFQNTIVIPIVVNPSNQQQAEKPFLQLPSVGEVDEATTPYNDLFTFQPQTTTTTTAPPTSTTIATPVTQRPTTTTTTTTFATTSTTTTTESPGNFIEVTVASTTSTTTRKPVRRPKPTKKPPRRKPTLRPTRRPNRPGGGSTSITLANLAVTPENDPGIEYVTMSPPNSNLVGLNSLQAIGLNQLGYSSLTGMTVVMKTLLGAMMIFLPSALVAAGILSSRRGIPFAKSDDTSLFLNHTGFECEMDCLVQLVADLTGKEPEFIRRINNSTEIINLTNSIRDLLNTP